MKIKIILILCLLMVSCGGNRTWTHADTAREGVYMVLHTIDWGQSLYISDHTPQYWEINPIIGKYPSRSDVNWYMGATMVAHPIISYALDGQEKYGPFSAREWWQWSTILLEGGLVIHNKSIGVRMEF